MRDEEECFERAREAALALKGLKSWNSADEPDVDVVEQLEAAFKSLKTSFKRLNGAVHDSKYNNEAGLAVAEDYFVNGQSLTEISRRRPQHSWKYILGAIRFWQPALAREVVARLERLGLSKTQIAILMDGVFEIPSVSTEEGAESGSPLVVSDGIWTSNPERSLHRALTAVPPKSLVDRLDFDERTMASNRWLLGRNSPDDSTNLQLERLRLRLEKEIVRALGRQKNWEGTIIDYLNKFFRTDTYDINELYRIYDELYLDYVSRNSGVLAGDDREFGYGPKQVGVNYDRFFFRRGLGTNKLENEARILVGIAAIARERKIAFHIHKRSFSSIPSDLRAAYQMEIQAATIEEILGYLRKTGKTSLVDSDFDSRDLKKIGFPYPRLIGSSAFLARSQGQPYFSSREEALLRIKEAADKDGIPFYITEHLMLDIHNRHYPSLNEWMQKETMEAFYTYVELHSDIAILKLSEIFDQEIGPRSVGLDRLIGSKGHEFPIYEDITDFILKARSYSIGRKRRLTTFNFRPARMTDELRDMRREDAMMLLVEFVIKNHRLFDFKKDFSSPQNSNSEIPFTSRIMFPTSSESVEAIFSDTEEFWKNLETRVKSHPDFHTDLHAEVIREIQKKYGIDRP